jgi:transcriptional regulator with XRE-family HTH domain
MQQHSTYNSRQAVGHELRADREAAGLSRFKLAALADCSPGQIQAIENGAVPKRSAVLARCRAVLVELGGAQ